MGDRTQNAGPYLSRLAGHSVSFERAKGEGEREKETGRRRKTNTTSFIFNSFQIVLFYGMTHVHGCAVSGVRMLLECEVNGADREEADQTWILQTTRGTFKV